MDIVEKDGTVRMTLSNTERAPGWVIRGKPFPGRAKTAGMIFYNNEGDEDGGLTFGGKKDKDGTYSAFGHLSFDRYDGDQLINLEYSGSSSGQRQGLQVNDEPPMTLLGFMNTREGVLKTDAGAARDSAIDSTAASIEFLDTSGKVIKRIGAE
jgi:hypothetical protein